MNNIEKIFDNSQNPKEFSLGYLGYLKRTLDAVSPESIADFIQLLSRARLEAAKIFFLGNGGSAATASHFANDVGYGTRTWIQPFRAIALTDNVAVLTALGNDYGYEHIFTFQLRTLMSPGDVVVAISASGNSPNVLHAVRYANENKAVTVGLTGFDGGELRRICQKNIHVPTEKGEYGPVEDIHMVLDHLVSVYLAMCCQQEKSLRDVSGGEKAIS